MIGFVQILGGLALFMYGIRMLSMGMEKLTGDQIQKWMDRVTSNRIKSAAFGAVATAMIQSSGLLMVTMIGLLNSNLMTVQQAIGVMLGQEIGTTLMAQIVAFDIGNFRLIFIIFGFALIEFSRHHDWKKYGEISLGIGIVFLGMTLMSGALDILVEIDWVKQSMVYMGQHPLAGVLAGLVLTAMVQSSSAVTAMVVAMGLTQAISLEGAVGLILGANIGSCVTGFLASIGLSHSARQASIAQILINVIGVLLFIPFIQPFSDLVFLTSPNLSRQIANAHTIFNVTVSALMFPFPWLLARGAAWLVPERQKEAKPRLTAYIDEMQYRVPAVALTEAAREFTRLGEAAAEMLDHSRRALIDQEMDYAQSVLVREDQFVDPVYKLLVEFVNTLMQEDLSIAQQKRCFQLRNLLIDVERVGDLAEDLAQVSIERSENNVPFSSEATQDLESLWRHAHQTFCLAVQAFRDGDRALARRVCQMENEFDHLYWKTRQGHITRLAEGVCNPEADVIFTETLRNLERISDHADNLGVSVSRS